MVDAEYRLTQLNAVSFPDSVDDATVRSALLNNYSLEIGAGLGTLAGRVWRIGLMGYASNKKNVLFCLSALANVLSSTGLQVDASKAVAAAEAIYSV